MRIPSSSSSVGKQSQLLLKPTKVELGLQVGVEFDKKKIGQRKLLKRVPGVKLSICVCDVCQRDGPDDCRTC